jgi:hypothetical protein
MGMSWGGQNALSGYDRMTLASANPITENKPVYWADHWTPQNPNAANILILIMPTTIR